MKVKAYCINEGTENTRYALLNADENTILCFAPNNWKTESGALRWAKRHGFIVEESPQLSRTEKSAQNLLTVKAEFPKHGNYEAILKVWKKARRFYHENITENATEIL